MITYYGCNAGWNVYQDDSVVAMIVCVRPFHYELIMDGEVVHACMGFQSMLDFVFSLE